MQFELPPLPYAYEALEPHISKETLFEHHDKHHQGYVNKFNLLLPESPFANATLEEVIQKAQGPLYNNGAQAWNHTFYWSCLTPYQSPIQSDLNEALEKKYGSLDHFKESFNKIGTRLFGSGWTWLVKTQNGDLEIRGLSNADNPIRFGEIPLLTCDVWEHAYYLDYKSQRAQYLEHFWELVNWDFVQENFTREFDLFQKTA